MEILENFVVFEGADGSGTSTQLALLRERAEAARGEGGGSTANTGGARYTSARYTSARSNGAWHYRPDVSDMVAEPAAPYNVGMAVPLHTTFEPTESPAGQLIRRAFSGAAPLSGETVAYLFAADRQAHLYGPDGIAGRCAAGELVVCDRYVPSSLVYQGITCGRELPFRLNREFPAPSLILYFDIDPRVAQERMANRPQREIYEYLDFQIKVREAYRDILPVLAGQGSRVETIDASASPRAVAEEVWKHISKMPIFER